MEHRPRGRENEERSPSEGRQQGRSIARATRGLIRPSLDARSLARPCYRPKECALCDYCSVLLTITHRGSDEIRGPYFLLFASKWGAWGTKCPHGKASIVMTLFRSGDRRVRRPHLEKEGQVWSIFKHGRTNTVPIRAGWSSIPTQMASSNPGLIMAANHSPFPN